MGTTVSGLTGRPVGRPRAWWWFLTVGALLVVGYHWVPDGVPSSVAYDLVGLLGLVGIAVGIRVNRPVRRSPWYLLLISQVLWVAGDVAGSVLAAGGDLDRFPTEADVFYLAAYPVLALSLLLLARGRRPRRDAEGWLDGVTVLIGLSLLIAVVLGRPTQADGSDALLAAVVAGAYPQLDALIFVILVALITTPGVRTAALKLLVVALGLVVVADLAAPQLDALAVGSSGWLDHLWLASYVLLGAAVLHPSVHELSIPVRPERGQFSRWRLAATVLTVLVPPVLLVGEDRLHRPISVEPIAIASAAMFLLVVSRMYLVIRQIAAANADRERAQVALAYQASHDSLTELPNRAQGLRLISASMARAQRSGAIVGLLFVDLDGFKAVNDTFGHQAGDEVLRAVAGRMQTAVRHGDMVGRLGGDEFVVLLEPVVEAESAMAVAQRLIAEVSTPIRLDNGHVVRVGASVGVAVSQDAGTDAEALLNEADTAAYRAKHLGRGRAEVFGETMRRELRDRAELERGLRDAIAADALIMRYRPVVVTSTGVVRGYEVQLSWDRPGRGVVPAAEFRPVAELSDLVFELDAWVLRHATRQLAVWNTLDSRRLRIGVDVSARHLARARVLEDVRSAVEESGIDPEQLVVEITDTTLIDDTIGFGHLDQIRELGVLIGLEDFGTGYSSVRRLQRLPIDLVKLDGSFLDWRTPSAAGLLRLMVQGVQNFGLPLVVTGVTDGEHVALLSGMGCEALEGPYFNGPFSGAEVSKRISSPQILAS